MATVRRTRTAKKNSLSTAAPQTEPAKEKAGRHASAGDIQEVIRVRAYEIFEKRGYQHGHDFDDWLAAENEVLAQRGG